MSGPSGAAGGPRDDATVAVTGRPGTGLLEVPDAAPGAASVSGAGGGQRG